MSLDSVGNRPSSYMNSSQLLKKIRKESGFTQQQLAKALQVSTILISMIESGQKPISTKMVERLSKLLKVHPSTITPSLFFENESELKKLTKLERHLIETGLHMQEQLVSRRAKNLKNYAK